MVMLACILWLAGCLSAHTHTDDTQSLMTEDYARINDRTSLVAVDQTHSCSWK